MSTGIASTTRAVAWKAAVYDQLPVLVPDAPRFWGFPPQSFGRDLVALSDVHVEQSPGPMGRRSRDEILTLNVLIGVTRNGSWETVQRECEQIAVQRLAAIEQWMRETDPTCAGTVLWAALTTADIVGYTPSGQVAGGHTCGIEAEFTAQARITTTT